MQLKELLKELPAVKVDGPLDRDISGITYDSRRVTPGMVFVAIPGSHVDGHEFIDNAISRGAAAIIGERNGTVSPRATKIKVADAREALARAAAAYYEHPGAKLKIVGVTGTNGKTTVAFMVKAILEAGGIKTGLMGTVRYEIGDRVIPAQRTTPEALEVQQMLAQMVRTDCRACVMEVSSHALDQKRVLGLDFAVAVFTNLTRDHLDYHQTMEKYFAAKRKLFVGREGGTKHGAAVINVDDAYGARLARQATVATQLTYGINHAATLRATDIQLGSEASQFVLEAPDKTLTCRLPLIGRHNIYNALAAAGVGLALDQPLSSIQSVLGRMLPVPGRLETISRGQPFGVYVDYAHTDDALSNVLTALREVTRGRVLLAFGCGGNRDAGKRPKMGRVAAELADFVIITSDNPRKESPAAIAAQIEAGFQQVRRKDYRVELDRRRAIDDIIRLASDGDTVLIAGKGHETYQEFEDTVIPFDDRVYARETLEACGYTLRNAPHET